MDIDTDPNRLLDETSALKMLGLPKRALSWREKRNELALPVVWITERGRRYRYGDILLVTSGARPLLKKPDETPWPSPYSGSEVA